MQQLLHGPLLNVKGMKKNDNNILASDHCVVNVRVNISYKPSNERNISKVLTAQQDTFIIGYREQISDAMWLDYF